MTLSVIIPVYHVEHTLNRCVESVLQQGLFDFEVILVDDGGDDRCPQMCDEWARKDHRVRVIHQRNSGLSAARNAGIDVARGDYLTFVDSDDYLDEGLYARLLPIIQAQQEVDLLEYSVIVREGGNEQHTLLLRQGRYEDASSYWLEGKAYTHTYAWNKIYRRQLFDQVRFPVGRLFEDIHALQPLMRAARVIITAPEGFYHYTDNPDGITRKATGRELQDLLDAHLAYIGEGEKVDAAYYAHVLNIQLSVYDLTGQKPRLPRRHFFNTPKLLLLQLLGMKRLCQLIHLLHLLVGHNHS